MLQKLLIICPLLFLAGLIDSVAGGGGLISMPAYMMTGMPMRAAYGCNKLQSAFGTGFALRQFVKNKLVDFKVTLFSTITAFAGSMIATKIVFVLSDVVLKKMLLVIFPVVAVLILVKTGIQNSTKEKQITHSKNVYILALVIGLLIGLYDGLFGPGGAMIAIFLYIFLMKYDMKTASGNAKAVIFASNLVALVFYMKTGSIQYEIAIPATIFNMAGNYVGSNFAIAKGQKLIRPVMGMIAVALLFKTIIGFF